VGTKVIEILPLPVITVDASDGVAAVLVAGGGIGMSATYIAEPYTAPGELVPVLAEFAIERAAITALWPESRRSNPNVRAFLALLSEIFLCEPESEQDAAGV
jgi:DNA-binding transcriptional LysR family regulator